MTRFKPLLLIAALFAGAIFSHAQTRIKADIQQAISWLPSDTETVITTNLENGPDLTPPQLFNTEKENESNPQVSTKELWQRFAAIPLRRFDSKGGLIAGMFKGRRLQWAIEGSRHFRDPAGLGEMPYEGCEIVVFKDDISVNRRSFLNSAKTIGFTTEEIEGQAVATYQEKMEADVWTILVAFPRTKMVLIATNRDYLQQVLARMKSPGNSKALPIDLPEWKHVNVEAPFWGLRHFDKGQAAQDPTSPFGGKKIANVKDDQAIGVTFSFDPAKSSTATVTWISGDTAIGQKFKAFIPSGDEGTNEWNASVREVSPGIVESSYQLPRDEGVNRFLLFRGALMGHATYW